jgi:ribonuclease P protein component
MKNGLNNSSEFFSVYVYKSGKTRLFAANIAKKALKKSTDRNLYKRRVREIYRRHKPSLAGFDVLIMPKHPCAKLADYRAMENALAPLLVIDENGVK